MISIWPVVDKHTRLQDSSSFLLKLQLEACMVLSTCPSPLSWNPVSDSHPQNSPYEQRRYLQNWALKIWRLTRISTWGWLAATWKISYPNKVQRLQREISVSSWATFYPKPPITTYPCPSRKEILMALFPESCILYYINGNHF
jgi:hypothetical protein